MKQLSNIFLTIACMIVIPVSGRFMDMNAIRENHTGELIADNIDSLSPLYASRNTYNQHRSFPSVRNNNGNLVVVNSLNELMESKVAAKSVLGISKQFRRIEIYFFPGTSNKRALVIGGVHGSELSSISVANDVIKKLQSGEQPYYNTIVIPCLFPDNAYAAEINPSEIGSVYNIGRYTSKTSVDPNRQMPSLGKAHNTHQPLDHHGRKIEQENSMLLDLINEFRPQRIVNLHSIRDTLKGGIYADPRTDQFGNALGFATDSSLAIQMALHIYKNGGKVPGNLLDKQPTALYHKDPLPATAGTIQPRNLCGIKLPGGRGHGISLGSWASTAVFDSLQPQANRPAIRIITVEFPGYKSPEFYADTLAKESSRKMVSLFAESITTVFLKERYIEEDHDMQYNATVKQ